MSVSEAFREQLRDLLRDLGPVQFKRMFGGAGVYRDGLIFGLVDDDVLYLKTDEDNRAAFAEAGSSAFVYMRRGEPASISYWRMPDAGLDDPDEAVRWARLAIQASHRHAASKKPARKRQR